MKKFLSIVAITALVAGLATTTLSADPAKGQKLYLKKLKKRVVSMVPKWQRNIHRTNGKRSKRAASSKMRSKNSVLT